MHVRSALATEGTGSDFLAGFFLTAALLSTFTIGLQVGTATEGASVEAGTVAVMGAGVVSSVACLLYLRLRD